MRCKLGVLLTWVVWAAACTQAPSVLSSEEFAQLVLNLSEESRYFDTDNLISNEDSYQHVVPQLRELSGPNGAYLGVGPDQNFTYIARVRPEIAFLIDLRRDNLLLVLYLKTLFQTSANRWVYLSKLLGKPLPRGFDADQEANAEALTRFFRALPADRDFFVDQFRLTWRELAGMLPSLVSGADRERLFRMALAFHREGLSLRFSSHGRSPRFQYPTLERLILETDQEGARWHYLNQESDFQFLRERLIQNLIVPVTGDLAGDKALLGIGKYLRRRKLHVSAFYVSNVEFYLLRNRRYGQFYRNLKRLPFGRESIFIRSYFGYGFDHPESLPGYLSTTLSQPISNFFATYRDRLPHRYEEIVFNGTHPASRLPGRGHGRLR